MKSCWMTLGVVGVVLLARRPARAGLSGARPGDGHRHQPGRAARRDRHAAQRRDRRGGRRGSPTPRAATCSTSSSRACYTITAELKGFKKASRRTCACRSAATSPSTWCSRSAAIEETITVEGRAGRRCSSTPAAPSSRSSGSSSTRCRSAAATRTTWPRSTRRITVSPADATRTGRTTTPTPTTTTRAAARAAPTTCCSTACRSAPATRRPTRRPMDAVEEITVSKNSVDAENGNSLGGIISLNMKSGTNQFRGSAYGYFRDPEHERDQPTRRSSSRPARTPARCAAPSCRCTAARSAGRSSKNKIFSFTSFEHWDDKRPLIDRPHGADRARAPRRLQPVGAERQGPHHLQPVHLDARRAPAASCARRSPATSSRTAMLDPVALKMLPQIPLPNLPATSTTGRAASTRRSTTGTSRSAST